LLPAAADHTAFIYFSNYHWSKISLLRPGISEFQSAAQRMSAESIADNDFNTSIFPAPFDCVIGNKRTVFAKTHC
jgi:hypothetical protein